MQVGLNHGHHIGPLVVVGVVQSGMEGEGASLVQEARGQVFPFQNLDRRAFELAIAGMREAIPAWRGSFVMWTGSSAGGVLLCGQVHQLVV